MWGACMCVRVYVWDNTLLFIRNTHVRLKCLKINIH